MKMSEKTLLKKIEQAFAENYCTGSYKLELEHDYDDSTYYVLYYTYETGETIAVDITVTFLGEVKFYSPVHCYYISNFNNHIKSVINVLRMLFDMIDSNKDDMINYYAKECTDCPDFCEEDCNENAECARVNDVFDGCEKESMKSKIIKYAMSKIGTKRVSTLDGMTLEYKNKCYNIYVDDNNVTVEEIKEEPEEPEEPEETEKHYYDYTSEDFIKAGIAKECTDCPDFCEEDCIENAECARGNDVFDGCKTVKEVMEVKQELNARYGEQVHKQMKAKLNPEWHHVSLATLANIDNDMLDEKRKVYLSFYKKWQEVRKNLRKCSCGCSYERCYNVFRRSITTALYKKKISKELVEYFDRQVSMVNVECGVWSSGVEVATGQHESRKYNRATLRY